ncbi:HNH endonuclease [Burkholderia ubonensis]|uniref:HNH endonuclease n=1 Tax=Burkholderia ubonensis TaxID=101571 RepID=UPI000ADAF5A4|nr:hypothetical protein [Burkholderia ubonensis]
MSTDTLGGGKLPGKTLYAGRRRAITRTSGFTVHKDTTGGEFRRHLEKRIPLQPGEAMTVTFTIVGHTEGDLIGYGVWFWCTAGIVCALNGGPEKRTLTEYGDASWNKTGSMWMALDASPVEVTFTLTAASKGAVALYAPMCGRVQHKHLDDAQLGQLGNMYLFAPEALFISGEDASHIVIDADLSVSNGNQELILKSCNRCARYLPVNTLNERDHLSFVNHCIAAHLLPCKHTTFSRLRNHENNVDPHGLGLDFLTLTYGYQLECRFCKRFEVNAALNPQRTSAQMKEDGARRRAFELLLAELYGGAPQLRYRHKNGTELADDIWKRFNCVCFNCGANLTSPRNMHLDHTRPLALLWPLDETATALCGSCNSAKRDRTPSEFYPQVKLATLAEITGIPLSDLTKPQPNEEALGLLLSRLDWFFGTFILREEMTKVHDGKVAGELVVKALQKVLARSEHHHRVNLQSEYHRYRIQTPSKLQDQFADRTK